MAEMEGRDEEEPELLCGTSWLARTSPDQMVTSDNISLTCIVAKGKRKLPNGS